MPSLNRKVFLQLNKRLLLYALSKMLRFYWGTRYISRDLPYQKVHPLRDAEFDADCLTPLRILKIGFS